MPRRAGPCLASPALALLLLAAPPLACGPAEAPPASPQGAAPDATSPASDAILASSDLPAPLPEPLPEDDMGVTVHRLANGMTVYISTERQKPRISAWVAVRTGSRNDPASSTGLAHYLEHMLFKGSSNLGTLDYAAEKPHLDRIAELYNELRSAEGDEARAALLAQIDEETQKSAAYAVPNEFSRLYGALGVDGLNAFTNFDATVYIADLPANRFDAWAQVEAERFADPIFRLFYPELEAVYEEKNRSIDSPFRAVWEQQMRALFPAHPYGTQTTIGEVEHLKVPAYGDMVAYFHRWYAPNNMAVILAGDIDPDTALPVLERTLGRLEPRQLTPPEPGALTGPEGRQLREVTAEGENSVAIAWRTVPAAHPDAVPLEVMDWIVDSGRAGLLNMELTLPQKVPSAGSSHSTMAEGGYWSLSATAKQGQSHAEVEALLLGVVEKLKAGDFDEEDVEAVVTDTIVRDTQALEFAGARVSRMQDAFINRMDWAEWVAANRARREVSKDAVVDVAKRYLGGDFVVVYRKKGAPDLPKIDKPRITPVQIDNARKSPFAQQIEALPVTPLEPDWLEAGRQYAVGELPAGRLLAANNPYNELFSLSYEFDRGSLQAPLLCVAFDALEASGTASLDAARLQKQLYALGSSINFGCNARGSSIRVSGLDARMDETLALLRSWLHEVKIEDDQLARMVENTISQRRDYLENPQWLSWALGEFARHGKQSALLAEPSNKALLGARPATLAKMLAEVDDHAHTTLYFGPRSVDELADAVALGEKHRPVKPPAPLRYRSQKGDRIYFLGDDVAKSSVSIGIPVGVLDDGLRPQARLLAEYFGGGMASLIFQEIREARGLAYFARGWVSSGSRKGDEWAFSGAMDTQSDKTIEALEVFLELVRERKLDAARIAEARQSLEQEYRSSRVQPRFVAQTVYGWWRRGDASDPRPAEREAIDALPDAELQGFADRLGGAPLIISVLGNGSTLDPKALAKIAPVTQVKPGQLTSWGPFPAASGPEK